jgi:hypothetical protein
VTYRVWRLFMQGRSCIPNGKAKSIPVLLSKPRNGKSRLPLTREDWYMPPDYA